MPVQGESSVKGTSPTPGDFAVGLERINKVVRVFFGKKHFMPKLSTQKVNVVDLVMCRQSPGLNGAGFYPYGAR